MNSRYKALEILREGKVIRAFKGVDTTMNRDVCIRRYIKDTNSKTYQYDKDKFLNFIETLCRVKHPNVSQIFDAGIDEDGPYSVAELIGGEFFLDYLRGKGTLSEHTSYLLAKGLLDSLQTIHYYKLIHGSFDLRSVKIKSKSSGTPEFFLLDFGLYSLTDFIESKDSVPNNLTHSYLRAPEIFDGAEPSQASDLYAVGHLLYIALSGGHPFAGLSSEEIKQAHQEGKIKPLSRYADVSEPFEKWIHTLMQPKLSDRPASSAEASVMLKEFTVPKPSTGDQPKPIPPTTQPLDSIPPSTQPLDAIPPSTQPIAVPASTVDLLTYKSNPDTRSLISNPEQYTAVHPRGKYGDNSRVRSLQNSIRKPELRSAKDKSSTLVIILTLILLALVLLIVFTIQK